MRKGLVIAGLLAIANLSLPAHAQNPDELCPSDVSDAVLLACAKREPEDSSAAILAYANLGSRAYDHGDYQTAAKYWWHTYPGEVVIDVRLHTRRGYTFMLVGETDLACDDAELSFSLLKAGTEWEDGPPISLADQKILYPLVVETLIATRSGLASEAATRYLARTPEFWGDRMERANVLSQLNRNAEALAELDAADRDQPDLPVLKNNRCVVLRKMGRPIEALPFCEQAVAGEPDKYDFLISLFGAYVEVGQCDKARVTFATARRKFPGAEALKRDPVCPAPRPDNPI